MPPAPDCRADPFSAENMRQEHILQEPYVSLWPNLVLQAHSKYCTPPPVRQQEHLLESDTIVNDAFYTGRLLSVDLADAMHSINCLMAKSQR